jgi:hypothetical protein
MMTKLKASIFLIFLSFSIQVMSSEDPAQVVFGDEVEDVLASKEKETSSEYIINQFEGEVEKNDVKFDHEKEFVLPNTSGEITHEIHESKKFEDFGYTTPGSLEGKENYLEIDKKQMSYEFRRLSRKGINLTYLDNRNSYESNNDIINQTIGQGAGHVKGGSLLVRSDQYFFHTFLLNGFWSLGSGVGFNSGKGIFVSGERSETTFRLWEIPLDLGLGLEIPIYHWFKVVGVAGPSGLALYQNRSDFKDGEKGKNKIQVSPGQFASAQFKINLSGFSDEYAHELYTSSNITNLLLNIEARYQSYQKFQDPIKVSGTSFGIGFTFEYL